MSRIIGFFVVGLLVCPAPALAQAPGWATQLELGKPIFVTTTTGDHLDGKVAQISSDALALKTPDGIRSVLYREVRKVEKPDSVSNGVWTGIVAGLVSGAALAVVCRDGACGTEQEGSVVRSAGTVLGPTFFGGLIGWSIDSAIRGRQTVFATDRFDTALTVSPARRGLCARVAITW